VAIIQLQSDLTQHLASRYTTKSGRRKRENENSELEIPLLTTPRAPNVIASANISRAVVISNGSKWDN